MSTKKKTKTEATPPTTITWAVDGWTIRLDEDGVSLHPGRPLEQLEVLRLLDVLYQAFDAAAVGQTSTPRPPTSEQLRAASREARAGEAAKAAAQAVRTSLGVDPWEVPF